MTKFTSIEQFEQAIPELNWEADDNMFTGFDPKGYTKDGAYKFNISNGYIDCNSTEPYGEDKRDGRYYYQDWADGVAWIKIMAIFLATR